MKGYRNLNLCPLVSENVFTKSMEIHTIAAEIFH